MTAVVIELHRTERPGDTTSYDHTARMRLDETGAAWVDLLTKGAGDTSFVFSSDDIAALSPLTLAQVAEVAADLIEELEDWIDEAENGGETPETIAVNVIRRTLD